MTKEHSLTTFVGEDTAVTVLYDYTPYRPMVWSGPMMGPEEPAELCVNQVLLGGIDIWPHLATADKDLLYGRVVNAMDILAKEEA